MSTSIIRQASLDYLIKIYGSQSELARVLNHPTLTQPVISRIQNKKRALRAQEARIVEQVLGIPEGWMDKDGWVRSGWSLIRQFSHLEQSEKEYINRILKFVIKKCSE